MKKGRIAIIDYQLGNLFSVFNMCLECGGDPLITNKASEIMSASAVILPGVGSFNKAMDNIKSLGLKNVLLDLNSQNIPILGICLGIIPNPSV